MTENKCRITNNANLLNISDFNRLACSKCYEFLKYIFIDFHEIYSVTHDGYLQSVFDFNETSLDLNEIDHVNEFKDSLNHVEFSKWNACCNEAKRCCTNVMSNMTFNKNDFSNSCETVWDGWSCHKRTLVGQISKVACPSYIISDECFNKVDGQYSRFECTNDGWFKNSDHNEWANYSDCFHGMIPVKERLIYVNVICHLISVILLVLGLIIFCSYRKLQVDRIKLHKHLFASLLFNSIIQLIWELVFMRDMINNSDVVLAEKIPHFCVIIHLLLQYSRSTNYFWMFSESFYLHKLLTSVFIEHLDLNKYYIIGWGVPLVLTIIFIVTNVSIKSEKCWLDEFRPTYIFTIPNILILIVNLIFLINIIRLIYQRLNYSNEQNQFRRTVKAALILVPLFGSHFILSPYIMCESTPGSEIFNLFNRIIENIQGVVVALIYCFFNREVFTLLKFTFLKIKYLFRNKETADIVFINLTTLNESERFLRRDLNNSQSVRSSIRQ